MPNDEQILDYIRTNPGNERGIFAAVLGYRQIRTDSTLYALCEASRSRSRLQWRVKDIVQSTQRPSARDCTDTQLAKHAATISNV